MSLRGLKKHLTLNREIKKFDKSCAHLGARIITLSSVQNPLEDEQFLAEAIAFRLYRNQERLIRTFFLDCCVKTQTPSKNSIKSKLRCKDWDTAEEILKAGNRFLDWGNPTTTRNLANVIFKDGFPISDIMLSKHSALVDLQRIRNFVAHDSREAQVSFSKTARNHLRTGDQEPISAGELLLYRKRPSENMTLQILFNQIGVLSQMVVAS
jgi:hypothetical protein